MITALHLREGGTGEKEEVRTMGTIRKKSKKAQEDTKGTNQSQRIKGFSLISFKMMSSGKTFQPALKAEAKTKLRTM